MFAVGVRRPNAPVHRGVWRSAFDDLTPRYTGALQARGAANPGRYKPGALARGVTSPGFRNARGVTRGDPGPGGGHPDPRMSQGQGRYQASAVAVPARWPGRYTARDADRPGPVGRGIASPGGCRPGPVGRGITRPGVPTVPGRWAGALRARGRCPPTQQRVRTKAVFPGREWDRRFTGV